MENLLYNLGVSLEQFKGDDGFHHLLQKTKLSLLSLVGEFESTKDAVFEHRNISVEKTRKCILDLNQEFSELNRTVNKLAFHVGKVFTIMGKFHSYCDTEISERTEAEAVNSSRTFSTLFGEISSLNESLKKCTVEFNNTNDTAKQLNGASIKHIEVAHAEAMRRVNTRQIELDTLRRSVQVKEAEYMKTRSPIAQMALDAAVDKMQIIGNSYLGELKEAMSSTQFALEQTAMTGWSSCNIVLQQLSLFLKDSSVITGRLGEVYNRVKNEQSISKIITREKRGAASQTLDTAPREERQPQPQQQHPTDELVDLFTPSYGQPRAEEVRMETSPFDEATRVTGNQENQKKCRLG